MGNKTSGEAYVSGDSIGSANTEAQALIEGGVNSSFELGIQCKDLHDSNVVSTIDPFVVVWLLQGRSWIEISRTDIAHDTKFPIFDVICARFKIDGSQRIKFIVYDAQNNFGSKDLRKRKIVGSAETSVASVFNDDCYWESPLTDLKGKTQGTIHICGEIMTDAPSIDVVMKLRCEQVENLNFFSATESFIRVSRQHPLTLKWMSIIKTTKEKGDAPKFEENRVSFSSLSNSDLARAIKFELFAFKKDGNHIYLGEAVMRMDRLAQLISEGKGAIGIPMSNSRDDTKTVTTTLHLDYFQAYRIPT